MAETETRRTLRALAFVDRHAGRPWFWPTVGLFPSLDYVAPFLPNQLLMIGLALAQPARWLVIAAVFVAGSAAGAYGTALLVQHLAGSVGGLLPSPGADEGFASVAAQVERWGAPALAILALSPFPPRLGVLVCAAAGIAPEAIALAVAAGRSVPATAICYMAARAPIHLRRLPGIGRLMEQFDVRRREASPPVSRDSAP